MEEGLTQRRQAAKTQKKKREKRIFGKGKWGERKTKCGGKEVWTEAMGPRSAGSMNLKTGFHLIFSRNSFSFPEFSFSLCALAPLRENYNLHNRFLRMCLPRQKRAPGMPAFAISSITVFNKSEVI